MSPAPFPEAVWATILCIHCLSPASHTWQSGQLGHQSTALGAIAWALHPPQTTSIWVLPPSIGPNETTSSSNSRLESLALFNYVKEVKFSTEEGKGISNFILWREKLRQMQSVYLRLFLTSCLQLSLTTTLQSCSLCMGTFPEIL